MSIAALVCLLSLTLTAAESLDDCLKAATTAIKAGERDQALKLANKAVEAYPEAARAYLLRGSLYEALGQFPEAIEDYTKSLQLDPREAYAYNQRGSAQFKRGKIAESVADFDQYLVLRPKQAAKHWQRGISLYYAGKFEAGMKQFESYEKVDTNDVENAVWHFLCAARKDGVDKARAGILKIGKDGRTPMMEVYALYKGEVKPDAVLAAAQSDKLTGDKRQQALFYAHLYLGLYYEVSGEKAKALEHLQEAAGRYRIAHYMGDVARVHEELLRKELQPEKK